MRALKFLLLLTLAIPDAAGQLAADARPTDNAPPKTAVDWFRRADSLTNIRMLGSPPFHMKVSFHAYPGIDFSLQGKSPIMIGEGTYEEWWFTPRKWRREVIFGSYHGIEVFSDGIRKFQASSDYEPSRLFLLLRGLLAPIPRQILEPELQERAPNWKVEHLTAGKLPYVRISFTLAEGKLRPGDVTAYEFLPTGILVRSEESRTALLTSWQDFAAFGSKLVPHQLTVRGPGLDGDMVTAEVMVTDAGNVDPVFRLTGDAAEPGMTLQPVGWPDEPAESTHFVTPQLPDMSVPYPAVVKTTVMAIVDRQGITREVELSGIRLYGQQPRREEMEVVRAAAQAMIESVRKIDSAPP